MRRVTNQIRRQAIPLSAIFAACLPHATARVAARLASAWPAWLNRTMLPITKLFLLLPLLLLTQPVAARQDPLAVKNAVEDFLRIQTQGLPGQADFTVGGIEPRNNLMPCASFEVALPPGARAWGRTNVSVSCQAEKGWKIFVPVRIRILGSYLITARPLSQGQIVVDADLTKNSGDLASLPDGILTEADQALGRSVTQSVAAGRPLRGDMLRQTMAVLQGQSVKVLSKGPGFQVTAGEGRALNNAIDGQVVQARMANGHIVSGIARSGGVVEVSY